MNKSFLNSFILLSVVLLVSSCGFNKITSNSSNDETTIEVEDTKLTFKRDNLKDIEKHIKLPNWIAAKSKNSIIKVEAEGNLSIIAQLVANKSVDETEKYWLDYFKKENFTNVRNISANSYHQIYGQREKDETLTIALAEMPEDTNKSLISLTYLKKDI